MVILDKISKYNEAEYRGSMYVFFEQSNEWKC